MVLVFVRAIRMVVLEATCGDTIGRALCSTYRVRRTVEKDACSFHGRSVAHDPHSDVIGIPTILMNGRHRNELPWNIGPGSARARQNALSRSMEFAARPS